LIEQHDFNSRWLGRPCGISTSPELLELPPDELIELCRPYAFVEVRVPAATVPSQRLAPANGLVQVDTQLSYRLSSANAPAVPKGLTATTFADLPRDDLWPAQLAIFGTERYRRLTAVDEALLQHRYTMWASGLVDRNPGWCLRIDSGAGTEGFSFASPDPEGKKLTLDLVSGARGSTVPGLAVFVAAVATYRQMGIRSVGASFSAHNVGAINAHIALGCRVTASTDIWFVEM
jgi:hypothetical protein